MQRYSLNVIEHRRWRVPVEAESEDDAIAQIKREQKVEEAFLIETHFEIVSCTPKEK